MLVTIVEKQRRAVVIVKAALLRVGVSHRAVCVTADSWAHSGGVFRENYAVFISSGNGEPFFETGGSIAEAVRNTLNAIKGKYGTNTVDQTEVAPF